MTNTDKHWISNSNNDNNGNEKEQEEQEEEEKWKYKGIFHKKDSLHYVSTNE